MCPCGWKTQAVYDRSTRRWRPLDLGAVKRFLEAEIRRVKCGRYDRVRTEAVDWAGPRARHTRDLEDVVTWLAQHTDKTTVTRLLRTSWEHRANPTPKRPRGRPPKGAAPPPNKPRWVEHTSWALLKDPTTSTTTSSPSSTRSGADDRFPTGGGSSKNAYATCCGCAASSTLRSISIGANHRGYGHHSAAALISMIYLCCGGITVQVPTER